MDRKPIFGGSYRQAAGSALIMNPMPSRPGSNNRALPGEFRTIHAGGNLDRHPASRTDCGQSLIRHEGISKDMILRVWRRSPEST